MRKTAILTAALVLATAFAGGAFAQERGPANVRDNWLSAEVSIMGAGARYERMIGPRFSMGLNGYANVSWPLQFIHIGAAAFARYYPWGGVFFAGLGLGYSASAVPGAGRHGIALTPEIGWKIDVGREGGFFLQPGIMFPITAVFNPFEHMPGVVAYLGLGIAF